MYHNLEVMFFSLCFHKNLSFLFYHPIIPLTNRDFLPLDFKYEFGKKKCAELWNIQIER